MFSDYIYCIGGYLYIQALFLLLYKSFSNVLIERLPEGARTLHELKSAQVDVVMAVDPEEPSSMELDNESQRPQNRFLCHSF